MNYLVIVLASFSVLVIAVTIYLIVRLYRKEAEIRALDIIRPDADNMFPSNTDQDFTVTDQFLYDRCCRFMVERRPFLVIDYQLQDLANSLYTNRSYLSFPVKISGRTSTITV